jgi:DNA polymerase (family 10)
MLEHLAVILELSGENQFKVRAYSNAARALAQTEGTLEELVTENRLEQIKGIGKAIAQKVREYAATGQIVEYQTVAATIPPVLFELVKLPGLGPKKAMQLHNKLGINSLGELEYACRENRLVTLPGFGLKTQQRILAGISTLKQYQGYFLLCDVQLLAAKIAEYLGSQRSIAQVRVVGDIRRWLPIVQDIVLVVGSDSPREAVAAIEAMPGVERAVTREAKTSVKLINGMNVTVEVVKPSQFTSAIHVLTGSEQHRHEWSSDRVHSSSIS